MTGARGAPLALLALALFVVACGGEPSPEVSTGGLELIDLAQEDPFLTITLPSGVLQAGAPHSIASGDFNGDGQTDLLLGAPYADGPQGDRTDAGEAYVLLGPLEGDIDMSQSAPDVRIFGAIAGDALGTGVAAGDLNGDGLDDIIVGAPNSNALEDIRTDMGQVYVIFGRAALPATVDTLAVEQDFELIPAEGFSHLGAAFAVADVNGDGADDLIAGAPYAGREADTPPGGPRTTVGEVYVVYGGPDLRGRTDVSAEQQDMRLSGVAEFDQFGASVAAADVNGDGVADIITGAPGYDPAPDRQASGAAFVFHGGPELPRHITAAEADVAVIGADAGDSFGTLVAAGDLDGDSRPEIVASAPTGGGPDNTRAAAGEVAVVSVADSGGVVDLATPGTATRVYGPAGGELLPASIAVAAGDEPVVVTGSPARILAERPGAGEVYAIALSLGTDLDLGTSGANGSVLLGAAPGDGLGTAVVAVDLDADGSLEVLVQAPASADASARVYGLRLP